MKKPILNEEVLRMRKMMGLSEDYDIDSHYEDSIMGDLPGETKEPEDDDDDLIEFEIPNWALSALINGDESGLTDEDQEKLNSFVDGVVSKYGNANFMMGDEGETDLGFRHSNDIDNLGNDCTMLFIKPSKEMEESAPEGYMPYHEDQSDIDEKIKKYMEWHEITDMTQGIKDYMALCLWKSDEATSDDNQEGEAIWLQRYKAAKAKLNSTMNEGAYDGRYDQTHGSPYDRGHSDAYYRRPRNPHKWVDGDHGQEVTDLSPEEVEAYNAGYDDCDDFKDWGMEESGFQGEPNFQLPAEGGDGVLSEEGDEISLSMATMSHLSDLQEQAPELRGKINFIKALVMKMECKTKVSTEELDALYSKYVN